MALISIGTGAEVEVGGGGAAMEMLGLGRDKTVMVLFKGAELQSLPWKVALAS